MAKRSKIARDAQRRAVVARYAERRHALKETIRSPRSSPAQRAEAQLALQRLPRDASPTRLRNRGRSDGRPRGYLRRFGVSRITLRELAHQGALPGVRKASW